MSFQLGTKKMRWDAAACTDKGLVRPINEDSYHISPQRSLFVLSDGMGGAAKGEVASALAVEAIASAIATNGSSRHANAAAKPELSAEANSLVEAIGLANCKIHQESLRDPASRGMGATVVAARVTGNRLALAHVGDSRAYLFRGNALEQLTSDHSLVAEQVRHGLMTHQQAGSSELQSVLTRALGVEESVQVDADEIELFPRDAVLLCSDGLTRMVPEPEIAAILAQLPDAQAAAERLVGRANECGGQDNITVIVIRGKESATSWFARLFPWGRSNLI